MTTKLDSLIIADRTFQSRLLLGTGKFSSMASMRSALEAARTELVTVALRRVDLNQAQDDMLTVISPDQYCILPNTSGARNAEEAIRLAQLARATGVSHWVKLEVIPDARYLLPDGHETLKAAEALVKDGFVVLPYIQADPLLAKQLEAVGCATVMPLASPIGSNQGVQTEAMLRIIIEQATVPVVVDAGLGKPSEAARVMLSWLTRLLQQPRTLKPMLWPFDWPPKRAVWPTLRGCPKWGKSLLQVPPQRVP
jgi:thiazole synthase